MKSFNKSQLIIGLMATTLLAACSKNGGFESSLPASTSDNSSLGTTTPPGNTPTTPTPTSPSAFEKLDLNSYVSGTSYENEKAFTLDKANNALLLYLPLPPGPFSNVYIDAPNVKGVKITTVLDSQQKARVAVSIPLKLIIKDKIRTLPSATTLPDGRALPMMPSGEYPSLGLVLNQNSDNKIYLYIGVNAVGMFLESSYFPSYIGITAPVKNQAGTRTLGYFTIVPKAGNSADAANGGLFLSVILPNDIAKIIDDHLSSIIQ